MKQVSAQIQAKLEQEKKEQELDLQRQEKKTEHISAEKLKQSILTNLDWSQEEQLRLEHAMVQYRGIVDKQERWKLIADAVQSKDSIQCIARAQFCKELIKKK